MPEYTVTEYKGKNCIARIHRPILTDEERKVREENIKAAVVQFYKETRGKYV
jgi:hypothetical protein